MISVEKIESLRKAVESLKIRLAELHIKEEHQSVLKGEILTELKDLGVRPEDLRNQIFLLEQEIEQGLQSISIPEVLK